MCPPMLNSLESVPVSCCTVFPLMDAVFANSSSAMALMSKPYSVAILSASIRSTGVQVGELKFIVSEIMA